MCSLNDKNEWSVPEKMKGDINTPSLEGSCSISPDGKTLFFSSSRAGGMGGLDIYRSRLQADGTWGTAQNLGDKINSPADEDAPFIHFDGRILLFSSKGYNSMGGYDIFKSYLNLADSSWSVPENMGFPINTPNDDIHYVLSSSGEKGYYSLGKQDGFGDLDLYSVEPGISGIMPVVALAKGIVTREKLPVEVDVIIEVPSRNTVYRSVKSNATTGAYRIVMPVGEDYKITWKMKDYPDKTEMFEVSKAQAFVTKQIDVEFTALKDTAKYTAISNSIGKEVVEGLVYRIQISSGSLNKKIDKKKLKEFGKVNKENIEKYVKFTVGEDCKSFDDALDKYNRIRASVVPDAFIVAFYQGKRMQLSELKEKGLLPKRQ